MPDHVHNFVELPSVGQKGGYCKFKLGGSPSSNESSSSCASTAAEISAGG